MALNGWHVGERAMHTKLGHDDDSFIMNLFRNTKAQLPENAAQVHTQLAPFIPLVTLDSEGRPWSSILVGPEGKPGFVTTPNDTDSVLRFRTKLWPGDPLLENLEMGVRRGEGKTALAAGVGVDFLETRRRFKFAGHVQDYSVDGDVLAVDMLVNQSQGNCPKYTVVRNLQPNPCTSPSVLHEDRYLPAEARLPDDVISLILSSDTVFLGTVYEAPSQEVERFPSHVGQNVRSGRPGFIRVLPSDGRTIVLPDFSGNRYMSSLGNIQRTPLASLTFISFITGSILYITGTARNHLGPAAQTIMPFQDMLTTIHVTGYVLVTDALPMRQQPTTTSDGAELSSYSPPVRYLAEESEARGLVLADSQHRPDALLTKIEPHAQDIATFTWETSERLAVKPGQAIILDFVKLLGKQGFQHMAASKPSSVNDDRLRTWTVTDVSFPGPDKFAFSITLREKPGGAVTGALFSFMRRFLSDELGESGSDNVREAGIRAEVVGVTGEFMLPLLPSTGDAEKEKARRKNKLLWIAGGIGMTPFLGMLNGLRDVRKVAPTKEDQAIAETRSGHDIHLLLSTREPQAILPLFFSALSSLPPRSQTGYKHYITIDLFSHQPVVVADLLDSLYHVDSAEVKVRFHVDRIDEGAIRGLTAEKGDLAQRTVYVCGPEMFERSVADALGSLGVRAEDIRREGFGY